MSGASEDHSYRWWTHPIRFAVRVIAEWRRDRIGGLSAEIAFFALLGFFPMVIALAALLGSADVVIGAEAAAEIETWLVERVTEVFGADNTLEDTVGELFSSTNGGALTVGAVLAVYAGSRGLVSVVSALDIVYGYEVRRGWFATRVAGLALTVFTLVVALAVLILLVVGPLLGEGPELSRRLGVASWFTVLWTWFRWPVVVGLLVAWATSIYHIAPHRRGRWRDDVPGAVTATVWWALASIGFQRYLGMTADGTNAILGLLGGALSLVVWMYLMALGLLLGAEVNAVSMACEPAGPPLAEADEVALGPGEVRSGVDD